MRVTRHTIWIAKSRKAVFDFFIDFSQAPRWRQYVQSMQLVGDGPPRVGSRFRSVMNLMGETETFEMEVLACEPPSLWRHRTFESDFRGYVEYRFEVEGDGTRVTLTIEAQPVNLYGWLAAPLLWLRGSKSYAEQLPQLKRVMEGR